MQLDEDAGRHQSIAPYDNLQPVMFELNAILQSTPEYSLSFGTVDTEEAIIRRQILLKLKSVTVIIACSFFVWNGFAPPLYRQAN